MAKTKAPFPLSVRLTTTGCPSTVWGSVQPEWKDDALLDLVGFPGPLDAPCFVAAGSCWRHESGSGLQRIALLDGRLV